MVFCIATSFYLTSCKKTVYPLLTNNLLNITGYIESNPTNMSLFDQILQRTTYDGFLQAYGSYTIFVPNDDAVRLYMKSKGKTSINDFNIDSLKALVLYHVIQNDTINTSFFIDGKLRSATMFGPNQYLTTGVVNINGVSSYLVNGQALVLQSNLICGNGILHVIDHVLQQPSKTVAGLLSANPKYSIFTQALVATTFYDTLNVVSAKINNYKAYTVFAQTDSVYQSIGIPNFAALKAKYSALGSDPTKPTDGLYAYMAYHIIAENSYLTDVLSKTSHISLSPGQDVISDVLQGTTIQLDYDLINGVQYPGVSVDRPNSNIPATNGVLHAILGDLFIKVFPPTRVDWDLADQPEFRKQSSVFRVAGKNAVGLPSPMTNIVFNTFTGFTATVGYSCQATGNGTYFWWNDILTLNNLRATNGMTDVTFTTPVIIKGKYKVWLMYQRSSNSAGAQFFVDGNPLQNIIPNFQSTYSNGTDSGPVLESKGIKRYTEAPPSTTGNNVYNNTFGFYLGIVTIPTTDHHLFRIAAVGSSGNPTTLDFIQFIPYDQDQETPRYYRRDGSVN
jgi:uncharacterized surface protein with fasciclin (FAS1) repeats